MEEQTMASNVGPTKIWKITYYPKELNGGVMGVAFVEADTHHWAMYTFRQLYSGQFSTIAKCEELFQS